MFDASWIRAQVAVGALLAAGCSGDSEESRAGDLFIRSVVALSAGDCTARHNPDVTTLGFGRLDISFGGSYIAALLIGNSLPDDARGVALRSSTVRVTGVDGNVLTEFFAEGTGFAPPRTSEGPGWGTMFVELLPAGFSTLGRVNATVRVFGELAGGVEVESSELTLPITVCDGCLIDFPVTAIDAATGACTRGIPPEDVPCHTGQDEPIDCRLCQENPSCRAVPR